MSAILIKPDSKHKIRNYFQLTARRGLFSFQCSTLSTSHNPNNKDNNSSPTYPDENIPQRDHHFLSFGEAVYFDCPDLCSYLGFGFCPDCDDLDCESGLNAEHPFSKQETARIIPQPGQISGKYGNDPAEDICEYLVYAVENLLEDYR